jgi:hypothetical protein
MRHFVFALSFALALGGCGGKPPPPAVAAAAPEEAISRIGDVTIRATALPTATLDAEVASRYGIVRDVRTVMLLVGVRKGADAQESALPARITATATNLSGQRQSIALRELRADGLLNYVGTVETTLPDTLRFELTVVPEGGTASTMQFSREFYPR